MRTEKTIENYPSGERIKTAVKITDSKGVEYAELQEDFIPDGKTVEYETIDIYANKGNQIRRKSDGFLCAHVTIGKADSIDNYEEIRGKQIELS